MLKLNPKFHGIIDYLIVILLFLPPTLFQLPSLTSRITYTLAEIHLVITLCTNFQFGIFKIIPFKTLGKIQLMISIILMTIALHLSAEEDHGAQLFYLSVATVIFITWRFIPYTTPIQKKYL
ncbi:hypothetical protein DBR11_24740 [Pedobacter sp. HMWF019]|uniref:hypothetical protein n=1 Tax=Pedobacter sp. HMWF019 TaxID=2056856 RepID=UPI000D35D4BD|nr:hypothetical protein [Pedobacter sp. HMWF019]PTS93733.1 hypothetical protein DBR11_24740 [Pedobacter sp. HMWF019]